jgi:hypothetical protein
MQGEMKLLAFVAMIAAIGSTNRADAWSDSGHMLVAEIAYQQLSLADRAMVVKILRDAFVNGPEGLKKFEEDLTSGLRPNATPGERDHYIFIKAATWPDIIREDGKSGRPKHPCHDEFHKADWHFINLPFVPPGETAKVPEPKKNKEGDPHDIIEAIRHCAAEVKSPMTAKRIRAARLCFLLHMHGDIHQPLHAATLFSDNGLLRGDQGGNLLLVRVQGDSADHDSVNSIHSVFDQLFGFDTGLRTIRDLGERITHTPELTAESLEKLRGERDQMIWAKESLQDAIDVAYLKGKIDAFRGMSAKQFREQGHQKNQKDMKLHTIDEVPFLPNNFIPNALKVAERRVALGGYRLADALNTALALTP